MLILTCVLIYFFSVKYERIKFLVIALKSSVEVYAWAPKPYHKFMAFKVTTLSALKSNSRARCGQEPGNKFKDVEQLKAVTRSVTAVPRSVTAVTRSI